MPYISNDGMDTFADYEDFISYADGDGSYAAWCQEIDFIARHFLSTSFFEFEGYTTPECYYREGFTPVQFFRDILLPEVVCHYGFDSVEQLIANNVMWGQEY